MKCDRYEAWWMGDLSDDDFADHREACAECATAFKLDERIEQETRSLPGPAQGTGLWDRIAAELEEDGPRVVALPQRRRIPTSRIWALAAVLVLCVGLGSVLLRDGGGPPPLPRNLLATDALARVEAAEAEYETAIRDLEAQAGPVLAEADTRLMLRYRQRLEIIDAQISDCREMLAHDNANAHVRRYLLAAYRDKADTLTELLQLAQG
ncbi:MAG: hypothetical protein GY838_16150 [bacterium]|nr:hypothetical protein [bacterium]